MADPTMNQLEIEALKERLAKATLDGVGERQQMPVKNSRPAIQDLVIADIERRKAVGMERYGTLLQPFNGRDALMDAYQEALDLCQYLRQAIEERNEAARPDAGIIDAEFTVVTE